jgi:hypothetical protein
MQKDKGSEEKEFFPRLKSKALRNANDTELLGARAGAEASTTLTCSRVALAPVPDLHIVAFF